MPARARPCKAEIIAALQNDYPVPHINPDWVDSALAETVADVDDAGAEVATKARDLIEAVRELYLSSDLGNSTFALTLPSPTSHNTFAFPVATLLQVESITEIGTSAFALQSVLEQRRDVFEGVGRVRRMPDPGQVVNDDDDDELDETRLPPYPRSMLRFVVSDGRSLVKAIEYRRIDAVTLGETALGSKILVKDVKVLHGMLLLTPENTQVLHHSIPELQATQAQRFVASLALRMGKEPPSPPPSPPPAPARAQAPAPAPQPQTDAARSARRRAILGRTPSPVPAEVIEVDVETPPTRLSRFFQLRGNAPPSVASAKVKIKTDSETFSDLDFDFVVDEGVLAQIEAVERGIAGGSGSGGRAVNSGSASEGRTAGKAVERQRKPSPEIIEISSD